MAKITIDLDKIKGTAAKAGDKISDKATDLKYVVEAAKEDIADKLSELDRMLDQSITDYNDAYTQMNDKGLQLFNERNRASDTIEFVTGLVNTITNKPKEFSSEFEEIELHRRSFRDTTDFAEKELQNARTAAGAAGAGLAAGASVAFMAPTAAMWVATTFGTASTGAAISSLSGAAATNAALAWLGGGALSAGGGGMVAGNALLALAGPVGWSIAGATLLSSIILLRKKHTKNNKEKNEEIEAIKKNTESVKEIDAKIGAILDKTISLRENINEAFAGALKYAHADYSNLEKADRDSIVQLVTVTKALSKLLEETVG